ncbi:MAG: hypothetical protein E7504_06060 [Ruminococcus sp.]|nr:hypothetical protein [Ruminococcus sp.]
MSFMDKLSANVTNAGKIVSQKVKNMSDASSLTSAQNTEKRNIQDTLMEIGKLYYEKHKNDPNAEFAQQIASILTSEKRIAELQAEIELVRAREPELVIVPETPKPAQPSRVPTAMVCMHCGRSYAANVNTCQTCGQALIPQYGTFQNKPAPQPVAETWYTTGQEQNPAGSTQNPAASEKTDGAAAASRFCAYCGKPCTQGQIFCAHCGKKL